MGDQKNLILAAVLSFLVIGLWEVFIVGPARQEAEIVRQAQVEAQQELSGDPAARAGTAAAGLTAGELGVGAAQVSREDALARSERVAIDSPRLAGSIALIGGRIDDLNLKGYREELPEDSPNVTLLSPVGTEDPYYALTGWAGANAGELPGPNTPWQLGSGDVLDVGAPVTLRWENGAGLRFEKRFEIDDNYLFSITQTVVNESGQALTLLPYGLIARHGLPDTLGMFLLHEGGIAAFDGVTVEHNYDDIDDFPLDAAERAPVEKTDAAEGGWLGFTDKYWLTALIPADSRAFTGAFKRTGDILPVYRAEARLPAREVAAGGSASVTMHLFAGAKEGDLLSGYEESLGANRFYEAIDWGWFWFLTKPFFWLLHNIFLLIGNFGVAIILLTIMVKAVLFPLAYKSYVSMSKMKKLQPETEKLRERYKEDPQGMQKAMFELYKKEKVNPASGCLPILLQIPIFFALYKVLFVTVDMRHAPFFGWIQDLSAPDPTSILNLFGALPYDVPDNAILNVIGLGVWPLVMGITMWLQQQLNPAPADPMQKKIFAWLPVVFTFMLATFPAGLVIYWTANNVLTIIQQATIMKSQGVKIELLDNVKGLFSRKAKAE